MSMISIPSAGEKRIHVRTKLNVLDGFPSARVGRKRKTSTALPVRRLPQSVPVKGVSRPIEVKIASTESEWEQAFALAAASYQARGYEPPTYCRLRFTPYHALPDTVTFVAKHEQQVVATFSIVFDNTLLGLPMESVYPDEIDKLRWDGRRIAETTTLADADLGVREFIQVFLTLIQVAMQHHRSQGGDTPVIAVNPRHKKFYTKLLGFVPLGPCRAYGAVQDHPAEAFWVDYDLLKNNAPTMYETIFGDTLSPEVLFAPRMPRAFVRQFSQQSSQCDPEDIEKILTLTERYGSMRRW
jgi:hypothetical protein